MNESEIPGPGQRANKPQRLAWAALVVVLLLVIGVRIRTLQIPLERDEGEYAYAGQLLLDGIAPYKLAYNMKLPGTYASYAALMAVFGETTGGIHLGFLLVNLATIALLFVVARRLFDTCHAIIACMAYGLLSMCSGVLGLEGHATHLVVVFARAGILLLLKARESKSRRGFAWSGFLFGCSVVCKQPGLFLGMFAVATLALDFLMAAPENRKERLASLACLCAGLTLPFLLTCLWMEIAGTFDRFWFWTVIYAATHGNLLTWDEGLADLADFNHKAGAMRWAWVIAAIGLLCLARDKTRKDARNLIGLLFVFSLIAFTASFYFSRHYFIVVLPVVCLLIAVAARSLAVKTGETVPFVLLVAGCAAFAFANRAIWFELSPNEVSHALYGGNPFPEAVVIGKYLQEHTKPDETIAVLGSEPEIFFYAHRHSASGYIYMYDLMQPHRYALPMQKELIQQIESAKPAFLLLVYVNASWIFMKDSNLSIMDWVKTYWGSHYQTAGAAWMMPDRTEYVWGTNALNQPFDTSLRIAILQRKPAP